MWTSSDSCLTTCRVSCEGSTVKTECKSCSCRCYSNRSGNSTSRIYLSKCRSSRSTWCCSDSDVCISRSTTCSILCSECMRTSSDSCVTTCRVSCEGGTVKTECKTCSCRCYSNRSGNSTSWIYLSKCRSSRSTWCCSNCNISWCRCTTLSLISC